MSLLPLLLLTPTAAFLRRRNPEETQRNLRSPVHWWYSTNPSLPGGGECVQNADYPENFPVDFPKLLYNTKEECCDNHKDISCLITLPQTTVQATLPPLTSEPTLSPVPKLPKWYPLDGDCKFDADYPGWMGAGVNVWTYLFDLESDCCLVHGCGSGDRADKWWPKKDETAEGGYACVMNNDYPSEFLEHDGLLFDTEDACCAVFCGLATTSTSTTEDPAITKETAEVDISDTTTEATQVVTTTEAATTQAATTTESPNAGKIPGADCPEKKWHISVISGGANTCTNDMIYPSEWESGSTQHLFASAKECCDRFFPSDCKVVDHCECSQNWHMSTMPGDRNTCTNDENYPAGWLSMTHKYFFISPDNCCRANFDDEECTLKDTCLKCIETWHVNPEQPGSSW